MNDHDDTGDEWTAGWRHLHVESKGWLDGREVSMRLGQVRQAALEADRALTKSSLWVLQQACQKLELEVERHRNRVNELHKEVGYLIAAIVETKALNPDLPSYQSDWEDQQDRVRRTVDASDIGLDRTARLYGLDRKPKR